MNLRVVNLCNRVKSYLQQMQWFEDSIGLLSEHTFQNRRTLLYPYRVKWPYVVMCKNTCPYPRGRETPGLLRSDPGRGSLQTTQILLPLASISVLPGHSLGGATVGHLVRRNICGQQHNKQCTVLWSVWLVDWTIRENRKMGTMTHLGINRILAHTL